MVEHRPGFRFPRAHRLRGRRAFGAVYTARLRRDVGPLTMYGRANGLPHLRVGLSVSRRVGTAVYRNRIKRLLREAYRLDRHRMPTGYDLIVIVRRHEALLLEEYRQLFRRGVEGLDRAARRREQQPGSLDGDTSMNQ